MSESAAAPTDGVLTIEQAAAEMMASPEGRAAVGGPAQDEDELEELPALPEAGDDATPPEGAVSGEDEAGIVEPPEGAVIEPPANWDADAKAKFAELPEELKTYFGDLETQRNTAVSTAQREAAATKQRAEADLQQVQTLSTQLADFLPVAVRTFRSRWGDNPDWLAVAREQGTQAADELRAQHDTEMATLQRLTTEEARARDIARTAFIRAESERFTELAPDVTPDTKKALGAYLMKAGLKPEEIGEAGAVALSIGLKAMKYDALMAQRSSLKTPPRAAASPQTPQVRPSGNAAPSSSQSRTIAALDQRLTKSGSIEDAVELMLAEQRQRR